MDAAAPLKPGPDGSVLQLDVSQRLPGGFVVAPSLRVVLPPGSILVLFGPSGAGKSTILRQIAGLERPDQGAIAFNGEVWCDVAAGRWRAPQDRRVGVVFQDPTLFPHLSVRGNIEYGLDRTNSERREARATELMTLLGIDGLASRLPHALSGGEAQRVAVARAIAPLPRLVLLDEPFAALDGPTRTRLRREVRVLLQRRGIPAILVTHDRTEALAMGDQMAVVIAGRVRQVAPVSAVFSRPVDADVAASIGVETVLPARIVESSAGLLSVAVGEVVLHAAERDEVPVGVDVYACIRAEDVTLELQSPAHASSRNHLKARVVSMAPEGPIVRVTLDCGFPLDALITRRAWEELGLREGSAITAAIKATSVHLVARDA